MSGSTSGRRDRLPPTMPMPVGAVLSDSIADLLVPGVVVELDTAEADALGAFEETALTETDAWAANADLESGEARDGE